MYMRKNIWVVFLLVALLGLVAAAPGTYPTYTKTLSEASKLPAVVKATIDLSASDSRTDFTFKLSLSHDMYLTAYSDTMGYTINLFKVDGEEVTTPFFMEKGEHTIYVNYSESITSTFLELVFNTIYNVTVKVIGTVDEDGDTETYTVIPLDITVKAYPATSGISANTYRLVFGTEIQGVSISYAEFSEPVESITPSGDEVFVTVGGYSIKGDLKVGYTKALTYGTHVKVYDYVLKKELSDFISAVYDYIAKGQSFGYKLYDTNIKSGAVILSWKDGQAKSYDYTSWRLDATGNVVVLSLFTYESEVTPSLTDFTLSGKTAKLIYMLSRTDNVTVVQPRIAIEVFCEEPIKVKINGRESGTVDAGIYAIQFYIDSTPIGAISSAEKIVGPPTVYQGWGSLVEYAVDEDDLEMNFTVRYTLTKTILGYRHFDHMIYIYGSPSASEVYPLVLSVTGERAILVKVDRAPFCVEDSEGNTVTYYYGGGYVLVNGTGSALYIKLPAKLTVTVLYKGSKPVKGAVVEIRDTAGNTLYKKYTDENGVAVFNVEPAETYTVVVTSGKDTQSRTLTVTDDTELGFSVVDKPAWTLPISYDQLVLLFIIIAIVLLVVLIYIAVRGIKVSGSVVFGGR